MIDWLDTLLRRLESEPAVVRVVVAAVRGSAPREPGACMLVSAGQVDGSIGGGNLEWQAIQTARGMLDKPDSAPTRTDRFALGATLGQCCGGAVELRLERYNQSDRAALSRKLREEPRPAATPLWLFGAGHVGRALAPMLAALPFGVTWIDGRDDAFPLPAPDGVNLLQSDSPDDDVAGAPPGAYFLVMTHSHDLDYDIVRAILKRNDFGWAGLIGSDTKARRFRQRLLAQGIPAAHIARLVCPIGIDGIDSKLPGAIAVSAAAQLQQVLEVQERHAQEQGAAVVAAAQRGAG
jgi:xanthine dehydrogenase accessory factor